MRTVMMRTRTLFPGDDAVSELAPIHNRTLPSRAAAASVRAMARTQAVMVAQFIASRGEHGATDREIQNTLSMAGDSQRPRRVWLRDHQYIQAKTESGEVVLRGGCTVWLSLRPFGEDRPP